jgi:hypothetical protein
MNSNSEERCSKNHDTDVASIKTRVRNWYAIFLFLCALAACAWYGHRDALAALVRPGILGPFMAVGLAASLLVFFLFGRVGRDILCFIVCLGLCGWVANIATARESLSDIIGEALRWVVLVICAFSLSEQRNRQ